MSLYTDWTEMVVDYVKTKGESAFWAEYSKLEKSICNVPSSCNRTSIDFFLPVVN